MTHTPGPWRLYQEKPHYYSIGTDYESDRGHDQNVVRDVRKEANARLIAAAPELLEALEKAEYAFDHNLGYERETIAQVKAAIRKARGGDR